MRHDLLHEPRLTDADTHAVCDSCGVALDLEASIAAMKIGGGVADVGGFGTSFYPVDLDATGSEALKCSHPSAAAEKFEVSILWCPDCEGDPGEKGCGSCGGSGMIAEFPDGDGGRTWVPVDSGGLSREQLQAQGLQVSVPQGMTEQEKAAQRGSFQNWLALRDATRPPETKSS